MLLRFFAATVPRANGAMLHESALALPAAGILVAFFIVATSDQEEPAVEEQAASRE